MPEPQQPSENPRSSNADDQKHCWVWPNYFYQDSCPFRHGARGLFALTATRSKCALASDK